MTFYQEGYDAQWNGLGLTDCPYKKATFGFSEWIRGFHEASFACGLASQLEAM